jgi:hypothetical protein
MTPAMLEVARGTLAASVPVVVLLAVPRISTPARTQRIVDGAVRPCVMDPADPVSSL